ncbi:hypothetical protein V8F44DRAFT_589736 [Aspergillus fumigatus]
MYSSLRLPLSQDRCSASLTVERDFEALHLTNDHETCVVFAKIIGDWSDFASRRGRGICRIQLASRKGKVEGQICSRQCPVGSLGGRTDSGGRHSKRCD